MTRFFRYSNTTYGSLNQNKKHMFAQSHALNIYESDAIYSFIPKNACSTLRTTVAYANGCIEDEHDLNWIHYNNGTFSASLSELAKAKYTFTVLRCPFSRLASVYLDKIVSRHKVAWRLRDLLNREIGLDEISFASFVKFLLQPSIKYGDVHWRPQIDFLVYKDYDDYFSLHNFNRLTKVLKKRISVNVLDVRKLTKHGLDGLSLLDNECFSQTLPGEILEMKKKGFCPSHKSLYNEELIDIVADLYFDDFTLYREVIGDKGILFT